MGNPKKETNVKNIMQSEEYKLLNELLKKELNHNSVLFNSSSPRGRNTNLKKTDKKEKMFYKERIALNSVKRMYKENKEKRENIINEINKNKNVKFNFKLTIK